MFGRWIRSAGDAGPVEGAAQIVAEVQAHLPGADAETVQVVAAITGLLGVIAYADRDYSQAEERRIRRELGRVQGMTALGIEAICAALRRHIVEAATVQVPRYCRTLVELADRELRVELLDVLVDVAAADGVITHVETTVLRQVTTALGLTQDDYNTAQSRHRDKLSVLKGP